MNSTLMIRCYFSSVHLSKGPTAMLSTWKTLKKYQLVEGFSISFQIVVFYSHFLRIGKM